ncbi:MAG: ABC transporter permease [Acidobacteriota bacterium]
MAIDWQDLRSALRALTRRPGPTFVLIAILGVGLGAATAVLDLTNLLAWRQLPVERPDELAKVFTASERGFVGPYYLSAYPDYVDYRDANESFASLAAHTTIELGFEIGDSVESGQGMAVSGNFFSVLGLGAAQGRPLGVDDDRPGSPPALVVSDRLWQRLGSDPELLGQTLEVQGQAFTVVGVAPAGFTGVNAGTPTDFFFPISAWPRVLGEEEAAFFEDRIQPRVYMIGRLQPGASRREAQTELAVLARQIDLAHPLPESAERKIAVTAANVVHPIDLARMRPTLTLFAAAVALLLVITCANVAHLLLARATARRREMGIRQSIGASRWRLARQLLLENLFLAFGGGVCGLFLAYWARTFLVAFAGSEFAGEMRFDATVLGASFLVCLVATLLFGLAPALVTSQVDLVSALKDGGSNPARRRLSAGQVLSAAQVALCVVLLVAGALLSQSLWHRLTADLGFVDDDLVIARLLLKPEDFSREEGEVLRREVLARVVALPEVEEAGTAMIMPPILFDIQVPFHLPEDPDTSHSSRINVVDAGYFQTLGIPLEQGRLFDSRDAESDQGVAIVNRHLAEQLWPGENAVGKSIRNTTSRPGDPGPDNLVIGVVGSIDQHRSSRGGEPVVYYAVDQRYRSHFQLVMRSTAATSVVVDALRAELQAIDPRLKPFAVRTGEANRREAFAFERMQAQAVGVFAVLGLLLAILGIFGVLSYAVSRRVREVGIRMALGARRQDVLRQVVGQGMLLAGAGVGLGLLGTLFSSRLLESLLYGVSASDLRVLIAVVLGVLAAAFGAAYFPARRASRLDPLQALRHE